jgi:hypothetical protein
MRNTYTYIASASELKEIPTQRRKKTVETRQRFAALREKSAQGSRSFGAKPVSTAKIRINTLQPLFT